MAHRQVETTSIHQSNYHTGYIRISPESSWEVVAHSNNNEVTAENNVLPCTYLDLATNVNIHGEQRYNSKKSLRWNKDVHFHDSLRLPAEGGAGAGASEKGILVIFEAMASEGVAVALSPQPGFQKGATVEITFGAVGNTKTTILRKTTNNQPSSQVSVPCRVCQEGTWNSFWVCVWQGKAYAGVGNLPGQKCLAFLEEDTTTSGASAAGDNIEIQQDTATNTTIDPDGTDATIETEPDSKAASTTKTAAAELLYVGMGSAAQQGRPIKIRNLHVTSVPSFVAQQLENTTESSTMDVLMDQQEDIDDDALKEYQEQCRKAKARAQKFGIEYKEPTLASVVPWSQARKLRANPQKGFVTGIDITDPDELAKQEARKSRFGAVTKKRELENGDDGVKKEEGTEDDKEDATEMVDDSKEEAMPIIQAWDNEELVRFQRSDPPSSLWEIPQEEDAESEPVDEFSMETDKPTFAPERIHIFSIDWSAFKQIRSEDLMAHFNIYGPSYVEWLGDLGCNILFEDKFSAVRALQAMTQDLPSPPPSGLNDGDDEYVPPDFGAMGWKMGRKMVSKVKNDRFGRRGTKARILMRPATSLDILVERPNSWPDPPPGFSTRRILGPGDDYNTNAMDDEDDYNQNDNDNRQNKRRRRNSDRDRNSNSNYNNGGNDNRNKGNATGKRRQPGSNSSSTQPSASDMLSQGLSSGRAGFSVEEMEAKRAAKKNG